MLLSLCLAEQHDTALRSRSAEVKGWRDLPGLTSAPVPPYDNGTPCYIPQRRIYLPYPPPPPSLPSFLPSLPRLISLCIPRGGEGSGEDFCAAGGDRLSVPSTYTNGRISAPHKNN